ncbi:YfhO family protein [Verrucomicrobiota bacterium]
MSARKESKEKTSGSQDRASELRLPRGELVSWFASGRALAMLTFLALTGAAVLAVFWEPFFSGYTLFSAPDGFPAFAQDYESRVLSGLSGGWLNQMLGLPTRPTSVHVFTPLIFLPPTVWHVAIYVADTVLLCLAGAYFAKGRGVGMLPAIIAGVGLGFSGYAFTLISAGHRGVFNMMPCMVLALGFLDRAICRRPLLYFALAGVFAGFGFGVQPDIAVLFGILAVAFAVFLLFDQCASQRRGGARVLMKYSVGAIIGLVLFFAVNLGSIHWLVGTKVPERKSAEGRTARERWEFATNWSLPPEEILEFIAPCVYGVETVHAKSPYWGRVGRSLGWRETRSGLRNLKQHTVYLGVIQLVFAAYAVIWALVNRNALAPGGSGKQNMAVRNEAHDRAPCTEDAMGPMIGARRRDVFFWSATFVVTLLLAMGRHSPLYRLFYALPLPYLSNIRAPIKFLHLSELALSFLFAAGLWTFLGEVSSASAMLPRACKTHGAERRTVRFWLAFCFGTAVLGLVMFVASAAVRSSSESIHAYWLEMGFSRGAEGMVGTMVSALRHGGWLFLVCSAAFGLSCWMRAWRCSAALVGAAISVAMIVDIAVVGTRYVKVRDMSAFYAKNSIADLIKQDPGMGRTSYRLSIRNKQHPLWSNFAHHCVDVLEPPQLEVALPEDYQLFFNMLQRTPLRLWQVTGTRFIVGPVSSMESLMRHPAVSVVSYFDVMNHRITLRHGDGGKHVLLSFDSGLPRAIMCHSWSVLAEDEALKKLVSPDWDPRKEALVSGDLAPRAGPTDPKTDVRIIDHSNTCVEIETVSQEEGVLVLNDRYDPGWRVEVDGQEEPLLKCNYIMRGVHVPAGSHRIKFRYAPYRWSLWAGLISCVTVSFWALAHAVSRFGGIAALMRRPPRRDGHSADRSETTLR